jgi:hypothetical protein
MAVIRTKMTRMALIRTKMMRMAVTRTKMNNPVNDCQFCLFLRLLLASRCPHTFHPRGHPSDVIINEIFLFVMMTFE